MIRWRPEQSGQGRERATAAHCFPSVIKSCSTSWISPEGEEAHIDSPHRSEGRLFSLDAFHETACLLSGNRPLWMRFSASEQFWFQLFPRSGTGAFDQVSKHTGWPQVFNVCFSKKNESLKWSEHIGGRFGWRTLCRRRLFTSALQLQGCKRWVGQRGCSCLLSSKINLWV